MQPTFTVSYQATSLEEFRSLLAEYGESVSASVARPSGARTAAYGEILAIIEQPAFRLKQATIDRLGLQGANRDELEADLLAGLQAGAIRYISPQGFQLVGSVPSGEEVQGNPPPPDDGEETF